MPWEGWRSTPRISDFGWHAGFISANLCELLEQNLAYLVHLLACCSDSLRCCMLLFHSFMHSHTYRGA